MVMRSDSRAGGQRSGSFIEEARRKQIVDTAIRTIAVKAIEKNRDELKSFVKAVKNRATPEVTGRMGRDALKIALSIMSQISYTSSQFLDE